MAPSWTRTPARWRWVAYALLGGAAAATVGPWIVVVLLGCGCAELSLTWGRDGHGFHVTTWPFVSAVVGVVDATGGLLALAWVALKVGALSYGGGFVIIPLMQADAVHHYHWMTASQFLDAVALGQITPGPVVHTVAVVGYAAGGVGGAVLAALVAFAPSFLLVLVLAPHFDRLRHDVRARAFLDGSGPAAIGAIIGVAIPLALALDHPWQYAVLAAAGIALLALRRSVVTTLLASAGVGVLLASAGVAVR
jgi:chromate transporter